MPQFLLPVTDWVQRLASVDADWSTVELLQKLVRVALSGLHIKCVWRGITAYWTMHIIHGILPAVYNKASEHVSGVYLTSRKKQLLICIFNVIICLDCQKHFCTKWIKKNAKNHVSVITFIMLEMEGQIIVLLRNTVFHAVCSVVYTHFAKYSRSPGCWIHTQSLHIVQSINIVCFLWKRSGKNSTERWD